MKTYFMKLSPDNIIEDVITFAYENYIEVELEYLPKDILSGCYKLEDGQIVEYPELRPIDRDGEIEALKDENAELMFRVAMLEMGAV